MALGRFDRGAAAERTTELELRSGSTRRSRGEGCSQHWTVSTRLSPGAYPGRKEAVWSR